MQVGLSKMSFKDLKANYIVDAAASLFLKNSISEVTMKDIADEAGVGEATIYRYFSKKQNIVLAVSLKLKEKVFKGYFNLSKGKTGFEKVEIFYNSYLHIFKENPAYFYFIKEFDSFMSLESDVSLGEYEKEIDSFKSEYLKAYQEGLSDGSIKQIENINVFYFSTTHALLELCKKMAVSKELLNQDKNSKKAAEIEYLIKIILDSLRK